MAHLLLFTIFAGAGYLLSKGCSDRIVDHSQEVRNMDLQAAWNALPKESRDRMDPQGSFVFHEDLARDQKARDDAMRPQDPKA